MLHNNKFIIIREVCSFFFRCYKPHTQTCCCNAQATSVLVGVTCFAHLGKRTARISQYVSFPRLLVHCEPSNCHENEMFFFCFCGQTIFLCCFFFPGLPFYPIVCVSASEAVGFDSDSNSSTTTTETIDKNYIQGAGDDEESWARVSCVYVSEWQTCVLVCVVCVVYVFQNVNVVFVGNIGDDTIHVLGK